MTDIKIFIRVQRFVEVSSHLGEVNSFYNSFSDASQKASSAFQKFKQNLVGIGLILKHDLLYFLSSIIWLYLRAKVCICTEMKFFSHEPYPFVNTFQRYV